MISKIGSELRHFREQSHNFKILVMTNFIYAFVLPVIDIFVAAYIMRSSNDPVKVVIYQLTIYTGIPLTFLINGFLLRHFSVKTLYAAGMLLSGVSMAIMMSLHSLSLTGIGCAGLLMGFSFGFYWSNRDFLSLANTDNSNRNYYYGLETFLYTMIAVAIPIAIGWFLQLQGGDAEVQRGYQIITGIVFLIAIGASFMCFKGTFSQPESHKFIYFKFHPLWRKFLVLAALKGLVQGFLVTAPAMLVMLLLGKEGALGTAQSIGAIIAATAMYFIGRLSAPQHRIWIFSAGLVLFAIAAAFNAILFNATGVVLFMMFLLLARPLLDLAYFPIQYRVINVVGQVENRTEYAYILNHEAGLWVGRFLGAGTFLALAFGISNEIALRYAVLIAALVQLGSIWVARTVLQEAEVLGAS